VPAPQVGTANGAMTFFRALASTLAVAVMGAILLAGLGAMPGRGTGVELLVETAGAAGIDMAAVFRFVFVAADIFLLAALAAVLLMEERPLRGPATSAPPGAPGAPPPPAEERLSRVPRERGTSGKRRYLVRTVSSKLGASCKNPRSNIQSTLALNSVD